MRLLLASLLTLLISLPAAAANKFTSDKPTNFYFGFGASAMPIKIKDGVDTSENLTAGTLRFGITPIKYFSFEGRYTRSLNKKINENTPNEVKFSIKNAFSGLVLIGLTEGKYRPYLALGVSKIEAKSDAENTKVSEIQPAYGAGLALYTRNPTVGLSFEYLHLNEGKIKYKTDIGNFKAKTSLGAFSITAIKHF